MMAMMKFHLFHALSNLALFRDEAGPVKMKAKMRTASNINAAPGTVPALPHFFALVIR